MLGTILIVDDEKHTREGLRQSLEEEYDVYTASNIEEAVNVVDADRIDLVLTDLRLGGEDGLALIEKTTTAGATADLYFDDGLRFYCHCR